MKVLVSGTNGSFGSELCKHLDDFSTISLRYGEISTQTKLEMSNCDAFVHCGALLHGNFVDSFDSNVLVTKNILDYLSMENPDAHLIYFSSMSVLQKKRNILPGDYLDFQYMTDYTLSKYISETICSRYRIPITIVRFSTLFYKNPAKDGLSRLVYDAIENKKITIYNNGVANRDFLPLDIATQYVIKLIGKDKHFGRTYNIASGKETSFKDITDFLKVRINNLTIENKDLESIDNVSTNFNCDGIRFIGEINFDIFEKVDEYIQERMYIK